MTGNVILRSGNTWTEVLVADDLALRVMDLEARYPTPSAVLVKFGATDPDKPQWDGWIRLLRRPKTKPAYFPTGLVPRLTEVCRKFGYQVYCEDLREKPVEGFPEHISEAIVDRDYQLKAVEVAVNVGRGILDMSPRSGKTRTAMEIHRRLSLPTVIVVPTDRIAQQTLSVAESFFGPNYAVHLVGTKPEKVAVAMNRQIVVATAQTAAALEQGFYDTRLVLMVDEWHHGASKIYSKDIFPKCDHVYYRYGMTGTNFRSGDDAMAMHALISNVILKVSSGELLQRGHLVPTRAVFLPVPARPRLRGVDSSFSTGHGKHGIHVHVGRNQLVTFATYYALLAGRKPLVLVGTKQQGYMIKRMLDKFVPAAGKGCKLESVEFVSTDRPRPHQSEILESYLADQEVKVLIGTSLLGEGVDLPSADALIYARGEKAEVSLTQNVFRVCTSHPGKRDAVVVDFADRHSAKLMKHSHSRLDTYYREPIFSVEVLQDVGQYRSWLAGGSGSTGATMTQTSLLSV